MSEEKSIQGEQNTETNDSTQAIKNDDVPYARFQEQTQAKNDFKAKVESLQAENAKLKDAQENVRQEQLKKNSEFETLYNETNTMLEKVKESNKALSNDVTTFREGLINDLPEDSRQYANGMDIKTLQEFVKKENQNNLAGKTNSSRAGVNPTGEFGGYNSHAEWATKDPKGYREANMTANAQGIKIGYGDN